MICAGCNFRLSLEGDMPRQVFTVLRKGLLVDSMRARAEARGQKPSPTYPAGTGARTRIDGILMDPRVATLVQQERVVHRPGLPGHDLLSVIIALDMACQQVAKIRKIKDPTDAATRHRSSTTWHPCSGVVCTGRGEPSCSRRTPMPCGAPGPGRLKSFCYST